MLVKQCKYKCCTHFSTIQIYPNKRVTFDTTNDIKQKLDKLTVMVGKLVTENKGQNKQFKPQVYQSKRG